MTTTKIRALQLSCVSDFGLPTDLRFEQASGVRAKSERSQCLEFISKASLLPMLAFALAGCAPKNTEIKTEPDPWRLSPELISADDGQKVLTLSSVSNLDEANGSNSVKARADASDWIAFPSLKNRDFAAQPVYFEVETRCQAGDSEFSATRFFTNVDRIKVFSLLPIEAVARPEDPTREVACVFAFRAKNEIGSTHRFRLGKMQIERCDQEQALRLDVDGAARLDAETRPSFLASDLASMRLERIEASKAKISLYCETFSASAEFDSTQKIDLEGLATRAPARARGSADQKSSRKLYLEQNCRLFAESDGFLQATAYFNLRFAAPKIAASAHGAYPKTGPFAPLARYGIFQANIVNSDDVDRWIFLPRGGPTAVKYRALEYFTSPQNVAARLCDGTCLSFFPVLKRPLAWTLPASDIDLTTVEGGAVFRLKARRSLALSIDIPASEFCSRDADGAAVGFSEDVAPKLLTRPFSESAPLPRLAKIPGNFVYSPDDSDLPYVAAVANPMDWNATSPVEVTEGLPAASHRVADSPCRPR